MDESAISIKPIAEESSSVETFNISDKDIFYFNEGLVGFSLSRRFALIKPAEAREGLYLLHSLDEPGLRFPLVSSSLFPSKYRFTLTLNDLASIDLRDINDASLYAVMTIPTHVKNEVWLNLQAPLVVNKKNQQAKQIILDGKLFPIRFRVEI